MKFGQLYNLPTNKIFFFSFNIILILISCSYIGLGGWILDTIDEKPNIPVIKENYNILGGLMVATGVAAFFTAFYGCFETFCRNKYSIFIYTVLIVLLFLLGIAVGTVGLVYSDITDSKVLGFIIKDLFNSNKTFANDIQTNFKCCGLNSPDDWKEIFFQIQIPSSCCIENNANCENGPYYQKGCVGAVSESIRLDMAISGGISLAIGLVLLLGVVLAGQALMQVFGKNVSNTYQKTF